MLFLTYFDLMFFFPNHSTKSSQVINSYKLCYVMFFVWLFVDVFVIYDGQSKSSLKVLLNRIALIDCNENL